MNVVADIFSPALFWWSCAWFSAWHGSHSFLTLSARWRRLARRCWSQWSGGAAAAAAKTHTNDKCVVGKKQCSRTVCHHIHLSQRFEITKYIRSNCTQVFLTFLKHSTFVSNFNKLPFYLETGLDALEANDSRTSPA